MMALLAQLMQNRDAWEKSSDFIMAVPLPAAISVEGSNLNISQLWVLNHSTMGLWVLNQASHEW